MKTTVVIPFRDRGQDPRRGANLELVMAWWWAHGFNPVVQSDGLEGSAPFNRHRAYNLAVSGNPDTDVFVFTEADMILPPSQISEAISLAEKGVGLVVPFTQYRYLSDASTEYLRDWFADQPEEEVAALLRLDPEHPGSIFSIKPESTMEDGRSIGAVNVVSKMTLDLTGGFTEATSGNWYDDNIIEEGFAYLAAPTRWVKGPAVHLYHLPGWKGDHLSDEDKAATAYNKRLLIGMRADIKMGNRESVRGLMQKRRVG